MTTPIKAYKLDKLACPVCDAVLQGATPVMGQPSGFKKGHISVCLYCAGVLRLGDSNFERMTPEQIEKLPKATQDNLKVVQASVRRQIAQREQDEQNELN